MRIAYIAPELPGLSSTFVYKEIFALEKLGLEVIPFSIHNNLTNPQEAALANLKDRTEILYARKTSRIFKDNFYSLLTSPLRYLSCLFMCIFDALENITNPRVGVGILFRFFVAGSLAKDLGHAKVQHVHAHFAHFPTDIAMYTSYLIKIPFSFTAHANDIFANFWLLKQKVRRARFVATISQFNIEYFHRMGCSSNNIQLVRCGVDTCDYPKIGVKQPHSIVQLGFLGRLVEKKGADVLLIACKLLKDRGISFHLHLLGDGPLMNELSDMVKALQLQQEVNLQGKVDNAKVFPWLNSIDIFVLPAQKDRHGDMDGIPVALMEAMLCETSVISTALSGIPELVIDNETGLLALPGDPLTLANCIEKLAGDQELRTKLTARAKQHVIQEFNQKLNAERISKLFRGR